MTDTYQIVPTRGLTRETLAFYSVHTKVDAEGNPLCTIFPYDEGKGSKVREWKEKKFYSLGEMANAGLFGQDRFPPGSAKSITVTEGEFDALSVFQMLGSKYPAVSIRGASSSKEDARRSFEYLSSFERIYLAFDNDEAGQRALAGFSSVFNPNKLRHVRLTKFKDANDYLVNGAQDDFVKAWYSAKPYLPKGIVADFKTIEEMLASDSQTVIATYPFKTLQEMSYGIRSGELVLFTAQEKVGKTEIFRAIEHHVLTSTDLPIAIIHLEESEKRSVQGLASYKLRAAAHLPDSGVSPTDVLGAYRDIVKQEGRCFHYTHFGSDDPDQLLDILNILVRAYGVRIVFLDHMTRLATGLGDDERRVLDYLSVCFAQFVVDTGSNIHVISHVNDDGKPRGSRMIAKECNLHVFFSRDKEHPDPAVRNTVSVLVRDNRFGGGTGPAGFLTFDPKTFTLEEKTFEESTSHA